MRSDRSIIAYNVAATMSTTSPTETQTRANAAAEVIGNIAEVDRVQKTYGSGDSEFTALHEVSLRVPRGRSIALLGRSGSGKSTLLNLLGAVDRPTAGAIRIGGTDLSTLSDAQL